MRAFIGIRLPDEIREALARLQEELGASGADVKWVAPSSLHVTLKFLDEITEAQRQPVEASLRRLAGTEPGFALGLDGVGAFPSMSAPRVVWVGLSEDREAVARIAQAIERAEPTKFNRGGEAAKSAIEMATVMRALRAGEETPVSVKRETSATKRAPRKRRA